MKALLTIGLTVAALALVVASACADGDCCAPPPPPPPPPITYVEQTVTCYKPVFHEREETCVEDKITLHRTVTTEKYCVKIPQFEDQKRVCTVMTRVPHEEVHEEVCTREVPVCVTDPCTGCTHTECKSETYVKPVKCTVWEAVPIQKEVTEKVCIGIKEEVRERECAHVSCEHHPETVVKKVNCCEMVPYQTTVKVPVPTCPSCPHAP